MSLGKTDILPFHAFYVVGWVTVKSAVP